MGDPALSSILEAKGEQTMSEVYFFAAPGATTGDPAQDELLRAHEDEATRLGVKFWNYGKVTAENAIYSKTSGGHLESKINPKTMEVRHQFTSFEDEACKRERLLRMALKPDGAERLRDHVVFQLKTFRKVYGDLAEFAPIWNAIDKLENRD
jgi:hypothetical protein